MMESVVTVLLSVIAAMTSTRAWNYYKTRQRVALADKNLYRDDLRKEVGTLRKALTEANEKITELAQKLAAMSVRVEFLENENTHLKSLQPGVAT
jgi:TolA-binding protein